MLKPYVRSRFRIVHPYQNTSSGYNLFVGCLWSSQTIKFESFLGQIPSHSNTSGESQVFRYSSTGDNPWQLAARAYSDLNDFHKGGVDLNTSYIFTRLGILIIFSVRWPCSDKPSTLCVWVEQSGRWSFLACTFGSQCPDTEQRRHRRHKRVFGRAHPTSATKPISRDSNHSRLRHLNLMLPKADLSSQLRIPIAISWPRHFSQSLYIQRQQLQHDPPMWAATLFISWEPRLTRLHLTTTPKVDLSNRLRTPDHNPLTKVYHYTYNENSLSMAPQHEQPFDHCQSFNVASSLFEASHQGRFEQPTLYVEYY